MSPSQRTSSPPPPSPGDQAMQQLQSQQSKLLDKIDELRSIGVGGLVELPQLIVCGNQSSGKSSVLEAISRVRFPIKSSVCTRFATEVVLRRNPSTRVKVSIEPGQSRTEEEKQKLRGFKPKASDNKDLGPLIKDAMKCMGMAETDAAKSFSEDVLRIEISGPDKPELTLVDLPGLYTTPSDVQGPEGIPIVHDLTRKYMRNSRSIILAVINAKNDYHLQNILKIAEEIDVGLKRTLGIVTQPDLTEANSEEETNYLQFVRNEKIKLGLGWHALRNRNFQEAEHEDDKRDETERLFFEKGRWASISRESVGIDSLRRRLSHILLKHVRRNLPALITDIKGKIDEREKKLARLGTERATAQQQRGFLLDISRSFEQITGQALNGIYSDDFFRENDDNDERDCRRLRAIIRDLNEYFVEAMEIRGCQRMIIGSTASHAFQLWKKDNLSNLYMDGWSPERISPRKLQIEMSEQARINRGIELPGSANQLLVGTLFRGQSTPWENLAREHLNNSWNAVSWFVYRVLRHLAEEHTYLTLVSTVLAPELERLKASLMEKLDELTAYTKRGHPLPIGKAFLSKVQEARTKRQLSALRKELSTASALKGPATSLEQTFSIGQLNEAAPKLEKDSGRFAAAEIIDQMQAYYDTAIVTFVDNIAILAIENCLLGPLGQIFTSQTINNMNDKEVEDLAAEQPHVRNDRKRLRTELKKLQAGLQIFNVFNSEGSSLSPPPMLVSRSFTPYQGATSIYDRNKSLNGHSFADSGGQSTDEEEEDENEAEDKEEEEEEL